VRRPILLGALTALLVPAGVAVATAPPDTTAPGETQPTPPPTEPAPAGTGTAPAEPTATEVETTVEGEPSAEPAVIFDEDGNEVALVTVTDVEVGWTDYEEEGPVEGNEYVRVMITVESTIPEDSFGINVDQFILQSNTGRVTTGENIRTAEQAEADEDVQGDAELESGEAAELVLTFQVVANDGPQSVFYRPDDERLVDIAELG
jgi:hypothetical protein